MLYSTKFKTPTKNDLQSKQFATYKISNALHISKLNTSTFFAFFKGLRMSCFYMGNMDSQ